MDGDASLQWPVKLTSLVYLTQVIVGTLATISQRAFT